MLGLAVSVAELATRAKKWRKFTVRVHYREEIDGLQARLVRDKYIELIGPRLSTFDQARLRAIFTSVFGRERVFNMIPTALAQLDRMVEALRAYVSLRAPTAGPPEARSAATRLEAPTEAASMARDEPSDREEKAASYEHLRDRSPDAAERGAASNAAGPVVWEPKRPLWRDKHDLPDEACKESAAPGPDDRVVLAEDVWTSEHYYLERVASPPAGDSGWFIGFVDEAALPGLVAVSVADLLRERPDLEELLSLAPGSLVAIRGCRIEAVLPPRENGR